MSSIFGLGPQQSSYVKYDVSLKAATAEDEPLLDHSKGWLTWIDRMINSPA
jgi:hypothetical protein